MEMDSMKSFACLALTGTFAALAACRACADETLSGWTLFNHENLLSVETSAVVGDVRCVRVSGATNKCDTAFRAVSPRQKIPNGSRELVVSVETAGSIFAKSVFAKTNPWHNSVIWYGANGKVCGETPLGHVLISGSADFRRMEDWCAIPDGAVACTVQFGMDVPNILGRDYIAYRNAEIAFVPAGRSRAAEFEARWRDVAWARPYLYPARADTLPKVTLRDDGMTLVDGKPFFPVGAYAVCKREFNGNSFDRAFAQLKAAGFNFAHTYGDAYEPGFFEAARKHGIRLWVASNTPDKKMLEIGRYEPSVLAWYLGDDTEGFLTPQELLDRNAMVKAVDPNRITCQAESVHSSEAISSYARYVRGTDVYMPESYHIRRDVGDVTDRTCVATVIRDMKRVFADVRAFGDGKPHGCWPILQWFDGWTNWRHFPSREQLFATSWAAIVHGAHGIVWYTYGGFGQNHGMTSTPERWQAMSDLATEISRHAPVLVERTPADQPTVEILEGVARDPLDIGPSVTCRHAGREWLFAVNAAPEQVRARIVMPSGKIVEREFGPFGVFIHQYGNVKP